MICKDCGSNVCDDGTRPEDRVPCPQCGSTRRVIVAQGAPEMSPLTMPGTSATPESYLSAAGSVMKAIQVLVEADDGLSLPMGLLSAHCLEISLKAFLLGCGSTENDLKRIKHRLRRAWEKAVARGLPLDKTPPHWCELLDACHDKPHLLRYPPNNTVLVLPSSEEILTELKHIVSLVEARVPAQESGAEDLPEKSPDDLHDEA